MSGQPNPTKMLEAFAIGAVPPYINAIPVASQIPAGFPGKASLHDGFPPATMTPIASGGEPPSGADMNGIINLMSTTIAAVSAGQVFNVYDGTYAAAIGGYAVGAILQSATKRYQFFLNLLNGNTNDPDSVTTGWLSSVPLHASSAPTAGTHTDNVLPGPSDYVLDYDTTAGNVTLNGFVAQRDGQVINVGCTGAGNLAIGFLAGTSANQVRASGGNQTNVQNDSITLQYCAAISKWIVV